MHGHDETSPAHRVVGFARALHSALDRAHEVPAWSMTTVQEQEALVALDRAESRLAALRLRVLARADTDDVGAGLGATSTVAWVAHTTRWADHPETWHMRTMPGGGVRFSRRQ